MTMLCEQQTMKRSMYEHFTFVIKYDLQPG